MHKIAAITAVFFSPYFTQNVCFPVSLSPETSGIVVAKKTAPFASAGEIEEIIPVLKESIEILVPILAIYQPTRKVSIP